MNILILFVSLQVFSSPLKVIFTKGEVEIKRSGKVLKTNELISGDEISTGDKSMALLKNEKETLKLDSNTSFVYEQSKDKTEVILNKGGVISQVVKRNFTVRVKKLSMGVRGTQFYASVSGDNKVWMCVREGVVDALYEGKKAIPVPAGKGIFVRGDNISEPKPFAWTKDINWNVDETNEKIHNQIKIDSKYEDNLDFIYD